MFQMWVSVRPAYHTVLTYVLRYRVGGMDFFYTKFICSNQWWFGKVFPFLGPALPTPDTDTPEHGLRDPV